MAELCLRSGETALIDDADYEQVSQYVWRLRDGAIFRKTGSSRFRLTRFLIGDPGSDQMVVNLNGDPLDCRRENLGIIPRRGSHAGWNRSYRKRTWTLQEDVQVEGREALIPLSQMKWARIDVEDLDLVLPFRWCARKSKGEVYYAWHSYVDRLGSTTMSMHRLIMGFPEGLQVDHIDGDGLNNTRSNLRLATNTQNSQNRAKRKSTSSRFKGVSRVRNRWVAEIHIEGKCKSLGGYATEEEAARAYDAAAKAAFGPFARLNLPDDLSIAALTV